MCFAVDNNFHTRGALLIVKQNFLHKAFGFYGERGRRVFRHKSHIRTAAVIAFVVHVVVAHKAVQMAVIQTVFALKAGSFGGAERQLGKCRAGAVTRAQAFFQLDKGGFYILPLPAGGPLGEIQLVAACVHHAVDAAAAAHAAPRTGVQRALATVRLLGAHAIQHHLVIGEGVFEAVGTQGFWIGFRAVGAL